MDAERLGDPRIEHYLAAKDVVLLGTVSPSGAPLITPMWFLHDAEALTMISVDGLPKVRNLRRDPRVCVVAESGRAATSRTSPCTAARCSFLTDSPEQQALAERFHASMARPLEGLWGGRAMPPDRVMFRIAPGGMRSPALRHHPPVRICRSTATVCAAPSCRRSAAARPRTQPDSG